MGYGVGVVHRDPINEEYCRPCCPGIGSLLGFLIGKAFNWGCSDKWRTGELFVPGVGWVMEKRSSWGRGMEPVSGGSKRQEKELPVEAALRLISGHGSEDELSNPSEWTEDKTDCLSKMSHGRPPVRRAQGGSVQTPAPLVGCVSLDKSFSLSFTVFSC